MLHGADTRLLAALRPRLQVAGSPREACEATCAALVEAGYRMPSVYLARGERLRCVAEHGYWQVFDGVPPQVGILGRVFRTGEPVELRGAGQSPEFLAAVPGIVDEVCVPLRRGRDVVGVLNLESREGLPARAMADAAGVAEVLADALDRLGGPPGESAAQRLVRHAAVLAAADDEPAVVGRALEAIRDMSGLDTAVIMLDRGGSLVPAGATGRLADPLTRGSKADWQLVASWIAAGMSCYSIGERDGSSRHAFLREVGACSFIAVPMTGPAGRVGLLVAADPRPRPGLGSGVELLELLAAQVATCLSGARLRADLRRQASRDPLTGLGHHGAFTVELDRPREPTAAVFVLDVDGFKSVNDTEGHLIGDDVLVGLADALSAALRREDALFRVGGDEFATVLAVHDPREATSIAERFVRAAREFGRTVSVGAAVGCPGEHASPLLHRADAALYAAKRAGRDRAVVSTCSGQHSA